MHDVFHPGVAGPQPTWWAYMVNDYLLQGLTYSRGTAIRSQCKIQIKGYTFSKKSYSLIPTSMQISSSIPISNFISIPIPIPNPSPIPIPNPYLRSLGHRYPFFKRVDLVIGPGLYLHIRLQIDFNNARCFWIDRFGSMIAHHLPKCLG